MRASVCGLTETITISGGGLTGLSLAIALRKHGIPVVLHEAGNYPRHRVCGEFISGISQSTLSALGIAEALADAQLHRSVTWFSGNSLLRENLLPEPALAISRHLLDDRLRKLATESGAVIHTGSRMKMKPHQPGHVWTAGRKPAKGKWIGIKAHIRGIPTAAQLEMHSGPQGYLGITPVEDGWSNACGLFRIDRSIDAKHADLIPAYLEKNGNTRLASSISQAEWKEGSFTAVAGFRLGLQSPSPGVLSLGDSHAIIPPFTGNGMTMAFQSAETSLPHLIAFGNGTQTWPEACGAIQRELAGLFGKRLTSARLLHPLLFHPLARPLLKHAPLRPILSLVR
jgi:2-polyprenyl-6-methoxyphenol hydroxylase-like FAD-dependent oxidoreductase